MIKNFIRVWYKKSDHDIPDKITPDLAAVPLHAGTFPGHSPWWMQESSKRSENKMIVRATKETHEGTRNPYH